jgi:hypothetical protein
MGVAHGPGDWKVALLATAGRHGDLATQLWFAEPSDGCIFRSNLFCHGPVHVGLRIQLLNYALFSHSNFCPLLCHLVGTRVV